MSIYLTNGEWYYGSYVSGVAVSRDVAGNTSTSYTLAPNDIGDGALIQIFSFIHSSV